MGVIFLVAAGTGIGFTESKRLARRVDITDQTVRFLQYVKTGIRYSAQPIEPLIAQSKERFSGLLFLSRCHALLQQKRSFTQAWKQSVEEFRKQRGLPEEFFRTTEDFGMGFGLSDVEGQLAHCDLFLVRFEEQLAEARAQYKSKSKLYILLGGLCGVAAALLIL